jgi:hypothetical protein
MQRFVFDRLGVAEPVLPLELRVRSLLVSEHRRLCADHGLTATTAQLGTVAGDALVTLPADFLRIHQMIRGSQPMWPLNPDAFAEKAAVEALTGSADTGQNPLYFMFEGPLRIRLTPTPTETDATAITLWYAYRPVAMTNDSDTPDGLFDEWQDALVERVVARVASVAGRPEVAADATSQADEIVARMAGWASRRQNETNRVPIRGYGIR